MFALYRRQTGDSRRLYISVPTGVYLDQTLCKLGEYISINDSYYILGSNDNQLSQIPQTKPPAGECSTKDDTIHNEVIRSCGKSGDLQPGRILCNELKITTHEMDCDRTRVDSNYLVIAYDCNQSIHRKYAINVKANIIEINLPFP